MPKVKTLSVSFGESIAHPLREIKPKLFSHSQIRPACSLEVELEDGEDYNVVRENLFKDCQAFVQSEIAKAFKQAKKEEKENG